jgi:hypothetical protein
MCLRPRPHRGRASLQNGQSFPEVGLHQCPPERKGKRIPVRSLHVPSHVPSHPQTAAKVRGLSHTASGFTAETDWLLEEAGFELLVPLPSRTCAEPYRPALTLGKPEDETRKPGRALSILRTKVRILQPLPARCWRLSPAPFTLRADHGPVTDRVHRAGKPTSLV